MKKNLLSSQSSSLSTTAISHHIKLVIGNLNNELNLPSLLITSKKTIGSALQRKKYWNFWRKAALFVQTKNPNQCRIYHKKLIYQHANVDSIVSNFQTNIKQYQSWKQYYSDKIINLCHCLFKEREDIYKDFLSLHSSQESLSGKKYSKD